MVDRRGASGLRNLRYWIFGGARQVARRWSDRTGHYVDSYHVGLLYVSLSILLLSCMDAMLTLHLLRNGAVEANPIMDYLIRSDITLFVHIKIALTAFCVVLLVVHHNFQLLSRLTVKQVLNGFLVMYILLAIYEVILIFSM